MRKDLLNFRKKDNSNQQFIQEAFLSLSTDHKPVNFNGRDVKADNGKVFDYMRVDTAMHFSLLVTSPDDYGSSDLIFSNKELASNDKEAFPQIAGKVKIDRRGQINVFMFDPEYRAYLRGKLDVAEKMVSIGAGLGEFLDDQELKVAKYCGLFTKRNYPNCWEFCDYA